MTWISTRRSTGWNAGRTKRFVIGGGVDAVNALRHPRTSLRVVSRASHKALKPPIGFLVRCGPGVRGSLDILAANDSNPSPPHCDVNKGVLVGYPASTLCSSVARHSLHPCTAVG
jgi:hypothetical protein